MNKTMICRICLAEGVRMHLIVNPHLQEIYEKLTDIPFAREDRSLRACFVCYARLQKCHQFMRNCLKSEAVLTGVLNERKPIKIKEELAAFNQLIVTAIQIVSIDICDIEYTVKEESAALENVDKVNEELANDVNTDPPEYDYPVEEDCDQIKSDPEDDIPLTKIKTEVEEIKKRSTLKKKNKKLKKRFKVDAHEILLTKQQQLDKLEIRAKSLNYTNSPYKCDLCYKGFIDTKAYENHKMKHDIRSGPHICEICRLRYRTTQQLRSHSITAHARIFKCNKCGHVSHTANQARVHEKWHSGFTYECQLCGHIFRKPTSYLSHMRKNHPTEHVCNICGESFVGKHGLQMHKTKMHNNDLKENTEEPAPGKYCSDCNIQFISIEAWKRHILSSVIHALKNEHSSQCIICGWRLSGDVTLAAHMKEHERSLRQTKEHSQVINDKPLRCQQCGSNYVNKSKLQAHINRTHLGLKYNKNIVCEVCGKKCTSNATLKYHQRTHTGERPYSCVTCNKRFSDRNQLRIHSRTHTGEKPYVCAACGKSFSQKPALTRHYRIHTGAKPYTCQYCSKTFNQSNSLKLHVKTVHLKEPVNSKKKTQDDTQESKDTVKIKVPADSSTIL